MTCPDATFRCLGHSICSFGSFATIGAANARGNSR